MPIVEPTPIDPVPTPVPSTADPTNFDARADAMLGWFPDGVDQINTLADNVYDNALAVQEIGEAIEVTATEVEAAAMLAADAAGLLGRSNTSLAVTAGNKDITLVAAKAELLLVNRRVVIINLSDPSIRMFGTIAASPAPTSTTARVTVVSGGVTGTGTYSTWQIMDAAFLGVAATAAELWAQATDAAAVSPKTIKDAKVWVALTDAATVTPSGLAGRNFTWTIGADRTLGAITNCVVNDVFRIQITQNGTGGWDIAWASGVYKRVGGLPTLAQTAGQKTHLDIRILAVDGSGIATEALVTAAANPTN